MPQSTDEAITIIATNVAQFMEKYAPAFPESTWPQMSQDLVGMVMAPTAKRAHAAGKREGLREVHHMIDVGHLVNKADRAILLARISEMHNKIQG